VRILLDENMPRKLRDALTGEGHEVHSVRSLRLDGIDNGALYELAAREYDFCFTCDTAFANRVRESRTATRVKLLRVVIPQTRQQEFVGQFVAAFRQTDWTEYANGDDWPKSLRVLDHES
jgi:predicted nuclease of predicted toxin-antitoxin system